MAGTIELGGSDRWDVPSWAFNFVLDYLVTRLDGEPIAQELQEVDEENIGFLNIGEFEPAVRTRVLALLDDGLVAAAEKRLPEDLPGRAGGIARLKELADLAGAALRSNG
jgi:hypothetical protein